MTSFFIADAEIPAHLPGEPQRSVLSAPKLALLFLLKIAAVVCLGVLTLPLWVPYLIGVLVTGRAPNVPRLRQVAHYFGLIWLAEVDPPGLSPTTRAWLTLSVLHKVATIPVWGLAWYIDLVIYGRALARRTVEAPLIEISATRSGSTQLARYLEADPNLIAPNLLQTMFPYLWLWRIVPPIVTRFISAEAIEEKMQASLPPAFLQRHEGALFLTDTFELGAFQGHLNHLSLFLGPDAIEKEFTMGVLHPATRAFWTEDFVEYLDGVARKTLLFAGPAATGKRFFVKGHFLAAADAVAARYPDGRFLTMIRPPARRLQSMINFIQSVPRHPALGDQPWSWVARGLARSESAYNRAEIAWFTRPDGPRRCVLRFDDYVRDLEGTLARVYRTCLDRETLPPHAPRTHTPRERTHYLIDRSLAQVGIDGAIYDAEHPAFVAWCAGQDPAMSQPDGRPDEQV